MPRVYLIEGPVGAGKSTFSKSLSNRLNVPYMNLDAWMVKLFRPDRPSTGIIEWYRERKQRCIEQIWDISLDILKSECDVILELGLVQRSDRQAMYELIRAEGFNALVYVIDAPKEERRARVKRRNFEKGSTFSMEVSDEVFEFANNLWEIPDIIECEQQEVIFIEPQY